MHTEMLYRKAGSIRQYDGALSTAAFLVGGVMVIWLSYIHFHLWQGVGYRRIPTIGPLFLVQSIAGVVIGLLVIGTRRLWAAVLGIGFAIATMAGFLISVLHGLFNFKDSWSAPYAHVSFEIEIVTIVVLALAGVLCLVGSSSHRASRHPSANLAASELPRDS